MLPRQFPCYDLQRLRNLLASLGLAAPAFQTPYIFLIPNKTSDAVAAVTLVLSTGGDDRPAVSARR
jgi:hypothetical protein